MSSDFEFLDYDDKLEIAHEMGNALYNRSDSTQDDDGEYMFNFDMGDRGRKV